jgi:hypothetical protein
MTLNDRCMPGVTMYAASPFHQPSRITQQILEGYPAFVVVYQEKKGPPIESGPRTRHLRLWRKIPACLSLLRLPSELLSLTPPL